MHELIRVKSFDTIDDVDLVSMTDWLIQVFGEPGWRTADYQESGRLLKDWCEYNMATYYARPSEDFHISEAVHIAKEAGNQIVVLEDLS